MSQTGDPRTQEKHFAQQRLMRLARYRNMQNRFEHEQQQAISRRRLISLRGSPSWGWLPL